MLFLFIFSLFFSSSVFVRFFVCVCVRFVYLVFVWFVVVLLGVFCCCFVGVFFRGGSGWVGGEEVAMPRQPNTGVDKDTHSFYRSPKECQLVSVLTSSSKKGGLRM